MVSGAFINASSAMMAQSTALGTISQNISNVNTTGYKAKETMFKTVMSETVGTSSSSTGGNLSIFGAKATSRTLVTNQGTVSSTGNWTDLAINGRGMFIVSQPDSSGLPNSSASLSDSTGTLYTRAGSFTQKAVGDKSYFTTSGGQYLMGWQADASGKVSASSALTAVYTEPNQVLDGLATSTMALDANVPSNVGLTASPVVKEFTTTDESGNDQTLNATWTRVDGDTWTVAFSDPDGNASIVTNSVSVTLDSYGKVVSPTDGEQSLLIDWPGGTTTPTIDLTAMAPTLSETSTTLTVYDEAYNAHSVDVAFEHSASGQWYMRIKPGSTEATVPGLTGTGDGTTTAGAYSIPVTFDGAGAIISPKTVSFDIGWSDGAAGMNAISMDISKLTQFSGDTSTAVSVNNTTQNGYASGVMDSASFNEKGELVASFSNGHTRTLFQVPVASFTAADQLESASGTLFRRTEGAGDISIGAITDQGSGASMSGSSVETSNVSIEDEFTRMIITQKAYSTNATVFKTADEMMTAARDLL